MVLASAHLPKSNLCLNKN